MQPVLRFAERFGRPCPPGLLCLRLTAVALLLGNCLTVVAQTSAQPLTPPQALASDYGCMTCHGLVRKQVGPGFAQISARYQGDAQAAAIYAKAFGSDAEFYSLYRSLNAYKNTFRDKGDILVLDPGADFFKYFKSPRLGGARSSGK